MVRQIDYEREEGQTCRCACVCLSQVTCSSMVLACAGGKPINVVQPQGPSFEVNGNEISWLNWNMRISFNHREGLVFHNVG